MKLSIVIPAYNEEKRIKPTLNDYASFFSKKYGKNFEILVVLNGCKDKTLDVVRETSKKYPQIRYIDIKEKIGKGGAIIHGFRLSKGELIGYADADNATKVKAFNDLVEKINGFDGIVASRWIKGAKINKKQPLTRRIASRIFNIFTRILFGIKTRDTQCGAKLFKKKPIEKVLNELGITQWAFDIDLLYRLKKNGFKVLEIPTEWHDQKDSKLKIGKTSLEMFLAIIRLRLVYSPFKFIVIFYNKAYDLFVK